MGANISSSYPPSILGMAVEIGAQSMRTASNPQRGTGGRLQITV